MKSISRTDIGRIRAVNEDRLIIKSGLGGLTLAVVADGMGGHQAGEIASQMAIDSIVSSLQNANSKYTLDEREAALQDAIVQANQTVFEFASRKEDYQGMGTTIVAALASAEWLVTGHIGDSRAYLITSDTIKQLTEDHSLVNELLRRGQITPAEAEHHPRRNVLIRALGTELDVQVDVKRFAWSRGDLVLLCSDGLHGLVDSRKLEEILRSNLDLAAKVDLLIEHALQAGGDDNISVVLIHNEMGEGVSE